MHSEAYEVLSKTATTFSALRTLRLEHVTVAVETTCGSDHTAPWVRIPAARGKDPASAPAWVALSIRDCGPWESLTFVATADEIHALARELSAVAAHLEGHVAELYEAAA